MYFLYSTFPHCSSNPLISLLQHHQLLFCVCLLKHSIIMRFCVTCIFVHCANVVLHWYSPVISHLWLCAILHLHLAFLSALSFLPVVAVSMLIFSFFLSVHCLRSLQSPVCLFVYPIICPSLFCFLGYMSVNRPICLPLCLYLSVHPQNGAVHSRPGVWGHREKADR